MTKKFSFPDYYDYPPFWTKQTNKDILEQQIDLWSSLICAFTKAYDKTEFETATVLDTPLFNNPKINRRLDMDTLFFFLDKMAERGRAKFTSSARNRVRIYWRTVEEWANIIFDYANSINMKTMTYYEISESDDYEDQPFHKIKYDLLHEIMEFLEAKGKLRILPKSSYEQYGVVFNFNK